MYSVKTSPTPFTITVAFIRYAPQLLAPKAGRIVGGYAASFILEEHQLGSLGNTSSPLLHTIIIQPLHFSTLSQCSFSCFTYVYYVNY